MRHTVIFSLIFLLFSHTNLIANEKLKNFDILIFANKGKGCERYPYKFLKDLNGKEQLVQTDKNAPIRVGIDPLISKHFNIGEGKRINRAKLLGEMFGRDVSLNL